MWSLVAQGSKSQRVCPSVPHTQWQERTITVIKTPIKKRSQSQKGKCCMIPHTLIPRVARFMEAAEGWLTGAGETGVQGAFHEDGFRWEAEETLTTHGSESGTATLMYLVLLAQLV